MSEFKGVWKILWVDIRKSIMIFWSILLFFLLLGIALSITLPFDGMMYWNTNAPILIYLGVIGSQLFRISIKYASTFGCTRKNIYLGTVTFFVLISILSAVIHNIVYFLFHYLTGAFDLIMVVSNMMEMTNFQGNVFLHVGMDFVLFMLVLTISMLITILWHQLGSIALYACAGIFALSVIIPAFHPHWVNLGRWLLEASYFDITSRILLVSIVLVLLPLLFIKGMKLFLREKAA